MTDYSNWKVLKSVIDYKGDDEEKKAAAQAAQKQYSEVAIWCNENGQYTIEEDELYCKTVKIIIPEPIPPTHEDIEKLREHAYEVEVDGITAHIQRLRDKEQTPEIEAEILKLIIERDKKVEEIKNRYPYPEE